MPFDFDELFLLFFFVAITLLLLFLMNLIRQGFEFKAR